MSTLSHQVLPTSWSATTPFNFIVLDQFLAQPEVDDLMFILDDEPVTLSASDIFLFEATAPMATTSAFVDWQSRWSATLTPWVQQNSLCTVRMMDMRAYAYRAGHYLLPHSDHQVQLSRLVAYAYYLPTPSPPVGGELELFEVSIENDIVTRIDSACQIAPIANRLVMFEVTPYSLHQVREMESGLRLSIAGWFYQ
jgi:hypothetical protein